MAGVSSSFISVRHVSFDSPAARTPLDRLFGRTVAPVSIVRDISFELTQGAHVTLYGKSGAGKSTLCRLLTGTLQPTQGKILINGAAPQPSPLELTGYVSSELSFPHHQTGQMLLQKFKPARVSEITQLLGIETILNRPAALLSTTERVQVRLAQVILADTPLVLLDDIAEQIGVLTIKLLLQTALAGRTCLIATRTTTTAEDLELPLFLLHQGTLPHTGTRDELANILACERLLDVWVEGLRYDLLRALKQQVGVASVRLIPSSRFAGQRLRIVLQSARYLPSLYNVLSQAPLLKIQELPTSLDDIVERL